MEEKSQKIHLGVLILVLLVSISFAVSTKIKLDSQRGVNADLSRTLEDLNTDYESLEIDYQNIETLTEDLESVTSNHQETITDLEASKNTVSTTNSNLWSENTKLKKDLSSYTKQKSNLIKDIGSMRSDLEKFTQPKGDPEKIASDFYYAFLTGDSETMRGLSTSSLYREVDDFFVFSFYEFQKANYRLNKTEILIDGETAIMVSIRSMPYLNSDPFGLYDIGDTDVDYIYLTIEDGEWKAGGVAGWGI